MNPFDSNRSGAAFLVSQFSPLGASVPSAAWELRAALGLAARNEAGIGKSVTAGTYLRPPPPHYLAMSMRRVADQTLAVPLVETPHRSAATGRICTGTPGQISPLVIIPQQPRNAESDRLTYCTGMRKPEFRRIGSILTVSRYSSREGPSYHGMRSNGGPDSRPRGRERDEDHIIDAKLVQERTEHLGPRRKPRNRSQVVAEGRPGAFRGGAPQVASPAGIQSRPAHDGKVSFDQGRYPVNLENMSNKEMLLAATLKSIAPSGVRIRHRTITDGDEQALLAAEAAGFWTSTLKVRRQSGAARMAARELLSDLGYDKVPLPRSASGMPSWPPDIVGSLAHDDDVAVAAIARTTQFAALGIDVEPAQEIDPELVAIVTTPSERQRYDAVLLASRLFFVIKEATYKALNPVDGHFLDFHDMEIDLGNKVCTTSTGKKAHIAFTTAPRVVALSFVPSGRES